MFICVLQPLSYINSELKYPESAVLGIANNNCAFCVYIFVLVTVLVIAQGQVVNRRLVTQP